MNARDDDELEEALGDLIAITIEKSGGLDIDRLAERILASGWRPAVDAPEHGRRTASVQLFKPSGTYYTTDSWEVPVGAIGPYDMKKSPDFRRIGGTGAVLVCSEGELTGDENWGFPHLFPGLTEETDEEER